MISVIIPVYNSNLQLDMTLSGFVNQDIPVTEYEIWIVDDGSVPSAKSVADKYDSTLSNINYVYQKNRGRSGARNLVRDRINGNIVVFNDADRIPGPNFLKAHRDLHLHNPTKKILSVGNAKELYYSDIEKSKNEIYEAVRTNNRFAKRNSVHKILYQLFDDEGYSDSNVPWLTTFSGNMSIRKSILDEVNWFDENFTEWGFEHFELGYRLFNVSVEFRLNNNAVNYHLAHTREKGELFKSMEKSHSYFTEKYNTASVKNLMKLMMGKISLQEFDALSSTNKSGFYDRTNSPLYLKIQN